MKIKDCMNFPLLGISDTLVRLVKVSQGSMASGASVFPVVVCSLRNGRSIKGIPINFQLQRYEGFVLIKGLEQSSQLNQETEIHWVPLPEVVSLELQAPSAFAEFLRLDSPLPLPASNPVTKLEARRQWENLRKTADIFDRFVIDWESFANRESEWGALLDFLPRLQEYMASLRLDRAGLEVLEALKSVHIRGGKEGDAAVGFENGELRVNYRENQLLFRQAEALRASLDSLF